MVAIVYGLIMLVIGEVSRRTYLKRRNEGTLPSMYDVRRVRLLNAYWAFLPLGAITVIAGIVQVISS